MYIAGRRTNCIEKSRSKVRGCEAHHIVTFALGADQGTIMDAANRSGREKSKSCNGTIRGLCRTLISGNVVEKRAVNRIGFALPSNILSGSHTGARFPERQYLRADMANATNRNPAGNKGQASTPSAAEGTTAVYRSKRTFS